MKRKRPAADTTRLIWLDGYGALACEKCGSVLHWNFGFRRCPYCRLKITHSDERRAVADITGHDGRIIR